MAPVFTLSASILVLLSSGPTYPPTPPIKTPNKAETIALLRDWFVNSRLPIVLGHGVPEAEIVYEYGVWVLYVRTSAIGKGHGRIVLSAPNKTEFIAAIEKSTWSLGPTIGDDGEPGSVHANSKVTRIKPGCVRNELSNQVEFYTAAIRDFFSSNPPRRNSLLKISIVNVPGRHPSIEMSTEGLRDADLAALRLSLKTPLTAGCEYTWIVDGMIRGVTK